MASAEATRKIVAVVIAADSPAGRQFGAIDELTAHLPEESQSRCCAMCSAAAWPCAGFDVAAQRVQAAGLPVGPLVPPDLHSLLWPTWPSHVGEPQVSTWLGVHR